MELRALEYFLAAAREGSISAAASSLHLSQPALSVQIRNLETELGKPLFIRGGRGARTLQLTNEGKILQKRAIEILRLVDKTEMEIGLSQEQIAGDIYIAAGETKNLSPIARSASYMHTRSPDITVHFSSGNGEYVLYCLDQGHADFGLVFGEFDPQKFQGLPLPNADHWGVLMPKNAPLAQKERIEPADLLSLPLILPRQRGHEIRLGRWMNTEIDQLHISATYNLVYNASLLVEAGLGYAICFQDLIRTESTNLCFRPLYPVFEERGMIVWKKHQPVSHAVRVFLQCLVCCLQQNAQTESICAEFPDEKPAGADKEKD